MTESKTPGADAVKRKARLEEKRQAELAEEESQMQSDVKKSPEALAEELRMMRRDIGLRGMAMDGMQEDHERERVGTIGQLTAAKEREQVLNDFLAKTGGVVEQERRNLKKGEQAPEILEKIELLITTTRNDLERLKTLKDLPPENRLT